MESYNELDFIEKGLTYKFIQVHEAVKKVFFVDFVSIKIIYRLNNQELYLEKSMLWL